MSVFIYYLDSYPVLGVSLNSEKLTKSNRVVPHDSQGNGPWGELVYIIPVPVAQQEGQSSGISKVLLATSWYI